MKKESDYDYRPPPGALKERQAVELEVIAETDLGYKCSIDDRYLGLVYRSEIPQPLRVGQYLKGWVKTVREDGKIDLSVTLLDGESREDLDEDILRHLRKSGAEPLSDTTPSEDIFRLFGTSKKNFKRAVGRLYKSRAVAIDDDSCITLAGAAPKADKPPSPWKRN
jgi:predicted RNA-binding protein (virulence factor B family)